MSNKSKKIYRRLNDEGNPHPSLDELVEEVIRDINNEICIPFRQVAVKGVIRAKNLYAYKNQKISLVLPHFKRCGLFEIFGCSEMKTH